MQVGGREIGVMATSEEPEHILDCSGMPPIPAGTRPLEHQVAGHMFGRSNGQKVDKIG